MSLLLLHAFTPTADHVQFCSTSPHLLLKVTWCKLNATTEIVAESNQSQTHLLTAFELNCNSFILGNNANINVINMSLLHAQV